MEDKKEIIQKLEESKELFIEDQFMEDLIKKINIDNIKDDFALSSLVGEQVMLKINEFLNQYHYDKDFKEIVRCYMERKFFVKLLGFDYYY